MRMDEGAVLRLLGEVARGLGRLASAEPFGPAPRGDRPSARQREHEDGLRREFAKELLMTLSREVEILDPQGMGRFAGSLG
jgi:hypothetical protein